MFSFTVNNRGSRLSVPPRQRDDDWQSVVEQRNMLTGKRAALWDGIQLKILKSVIYPCKIIDSRLVITSVCLGACVSVWCACHSMKGLYDVSTPYNFLIYALFLKESFQQNWCLLTLTANGCIPQEYNSIRKMRSSHDQVK